MPGKVLVIENDPGIIEIIALILQDSSLEVICSRYSSIINDIDTILPNLILLDHLLIDGFGSDICMGLKAGPLTEHIPVILLSAVNGLEEIAKGAAADGFITKPFDIEHFEEVVSFHLRGSVI